MAGAGRLRSSRVIFLREWTSRKQFSKIEYCFPFAYSLRQITKPLSSPLEVSENFFRSGCGKSNALSEAAVPTSTPLKNGCKRGGDDRQVSQNGMPFCTGCTLSGHILNLQGSSTPFEPLVSSPKKETAKRPMEVSMFHFWIRWGIYPLHYILHRKMFQGGILSIIWRESLLEFLPFELLFALRSYCDMAGHLAGSNS